MEIAVKLKCLDCRRRLKYDGFEVDVDSVELFFTCPCCKRTIRYCYHFRQESPDVTCYLYCDRCNEMTTSGEIPTCPSCGWRVKANEVVDRTWGKRKRVKVLETSKWKT